MRQLILDLLPEIPPTLDNFVADGNAETLAALTGWLAGERPETSFCLWGEAGSGRSHLLLASGFVYIDAFTKLMANLRKSLRSCSVESLKKSSAAFLK